MNKNHQQKYLERLCLETIESGLSGLTTLQQKHMQCVPFENLDVVVGRDIKLDFEHLFNKIVERRRGGYCFELNSLYASLLRSFDFNPRPVLGRVWLRNPREMPPRNHLAHLVCLEGKTYLTDVGFGAYSPRIPLDINCHQEIADGDGVVRIIATEPMQYMVQRKVGRDWENQYSFEDVGISDEDIQMANFYMSKSESSHFYKHRFVGLFTADGRVGLFENTLSRRVGTATTQGANIADREEWLSCLNRTFNIRLDYSAKESSLLFPGS